jgi:hypothetical protein
VSIKPKIVIASIARDIANTFEKDYKRIISSFSDFEIINWIVIESNSSDKSKEVLKKFSKSSNIIIYKSLLKSSNESLLRTQELALARNTYLSILSDIRQKIDIEYLVVCDLNNLNNKLNSKAIKSCWLKKDWAAVTANQNGPYYDIWALRHEYWNNVDCWERFEELKKIYSQTSLALWDSVYSRMIKISKADTWIKVDSAFGGIAIYNTQYLNQNYYLGITPSGKQVCEHVSFNAGITKNGGWIYINPNFINFNLTDHSRRKKYFKFYNLKYNFAKLFLLKKGSTKN